MGVNIRGAFKKLESLTQEDWKRLKESIAEMQAEVEDALAKYAPGGQRVSPVE